ncbi:hypothetical protein F4804DRAFT_332980 [Jackrogersella minutella]|nr:hypothetical protein F4804DRAFT_332980 [Jackrogersella minutella]
MPTEERSSDFCPTCGKEFTPRSLQEHCSSSHLGSFCFFPNSKLTLAKEDDGRMADELLAANEKQGEVRTKDGRFRCNWPGCKKKDHAYDGIASLRRHLRAKQREEYQRYLKDATNGVGPAPQVNYQVIEAWNDLYIKRAWRDAAFHCLGLLITPLGSLDEVSFGRRQFILNNVIEADNQFGEAVYNIKSLTRNPRNANFWDRYNDESANFRQRLLAWASTPELIPDITYEWRFINDIIIRTNQILEHIRNVGA